MAKEYKPTYTTLVQIDKALDAVVKSYKGFRNELHSILCSAIAHDLACREKGGSIQTVLTKVFSRIDTEMTTINSRHVLAWLRGVYGNSLKWAEHEKKKGQYQFTLGKNASVTPVIKDTDDDGETVEKHYSELPFWEYSVARADKPDWSFAGQLERILNRAKTLEEKGSLPKEEIALAHMVRDTMGAIDLTPKKEGNKITGYEYKSGAVKELSAVASKMIAGKQKESVTQH